MAAAFVGNEVALTGTTWVTVVAAPGAGKQRELLSCWVDNLDTVDHTFHLRKNKAGVFFNYPDVFVSTLQRGQLSSGGIVLDATDESIEVSDDATATTTAPKADAGIFEVP